MKSPLHADLNDPPVRTALAMTIRMKRAGMISPSPAPALTRRISARAHGRRDR